MELVNRYMQKNNQYLMETFESMGKSGKIEAAKIFNFIQTGFDKEDFRFQLNGRDFFEQDENATQMQKLLQSYYRITQSDQSKKFYLYRIEFTFDEISDILEFWLQRQPQLKIVYIEDSGEGQVARGSIIVGAQIHNTEQEEVIKNKKTNDINLKDLPEEGNQFEIDDQQIPNLIEEYQRDIEVLKLKQHQTNQDHEKKQINQKIEELQMKIKVLEQRSRASESNKAKSLKTGNKGRSNSVMEESTKTVQSRVSSNKKTSINYKAVFDFYAKQTHLTGAKATFERIQHESQSINYQKLVHFLRQYSLMPNSGSDKKKVHGMYIKFCDHTRDLSLDGFMNVLDGVASLLFPDKQKQDRSELLKAKIIENIKNTKILNHPFHSLEKEDFRINANQLNYSFKLKPQDGKFVHEVNNSIQKRRQDKHEAKSQRSKQKEQKQIRFLRKLQSIDPFNPMLAKNSKLLEEKPKQYQPIASLENIEKYRDNSFNFENHFGIDSSIDISSSVGHSGDSPSRASSNMKRQYSQRYRKSQDTQKRVLKLQKQQYSKMESLMSGIIERTNAKMQKMGISPTKLDKSVKFS